MRFVRHRRLAIPPRAWLAQGLRNRFGLSFWLDSRQRLDDLPLPSRRDGAIARERRQYALVSQVLAPGLELLRVLANVLAELDQRGPETVRVEVRQPRRLEGFLEDRADR